MARTKGSNGQRLDNLEKDVEKLKEQMRSCQTAIETNIKDDLQVETYTNSGRYLFTYEDIAKRYDVSVSKVQRIASENNLSRRKSS